MIQRVYEQASRSRASSVYVATDDERIAAEVRRFNGHVVMTKSDHPTGTDRLYEAVSKLGLDASDVVVNVQGDEPLIPPSVIDAVAGMIDAGVQMSTLCERITNVDEIFDPNVVKVVRDIHDMALYFSRAPISWSRDHFGAAASGDINANTLSDDVICYRHLGIYAYTASMLEQFVSWQPTRLEETEKLEQLRVLANGERIKVAESPEKIPPGIDVPADVERTLKALQERT